VKISEDYKRELRRKVFHCLSLVYLALFNFAGLIPTLWVLGVWVAVVGAVEAFRLRRPEFNRLVMRVFGGIHREAELGKISGVFWTSLGCWLTLLFFGGEPRAVAAGLFYLALGDSSAALVGKAVGRLKVEFWGRRKTLEGSAACLLVCLAAGWGLGLPPKALAAGAAAATVVEFVPVPLDDNLWLPLLSGAVVFLFV